jgi:predicted GH43/DUF377 family glycosyl hydrolase
LNHLLPVTPPAGNWPIRFDELSLWPTFPGRRLNPSILVDGDGYLFAVRDGWRAGRILVGRMDAHFRPVGRPHHLEVRHRDAARGQEDPRLFRYRGHPHVALTGSVGDVRVVVQNQLFARLSPDGVRVDREYAPAYGPRNKDEKNWGFFEHDGGLYAVYSFSPCRILRIEGETATLAHETTTAAVWQGGEVRGGAAPVRVGDELWCFTHDRIVEAGRRLYRTGLVVLNGRPPFRVCRMLDRPLLVADPNTRPKFQYADVVFPGGAVLAGDHWVVSHGVHDRWSELNRFGHGELESRLEPVQDAARGE